MTYEQFKAQYEALVKRLISYDIETIGHHEMSAQLAELVETYPEHEERYDDELDAQYD